MVFDKETANAVLKILDRMSYRKVEGDLRFDLETMMRCVLNDKISTIRLPKGTWAEDLHYCKEGIIKDEMEWNADYLFIIAVACMINEAIEIGELGKI